MSLLQELLALSEAAEKKVVTAKLWIGYINHDDEEKDVTVTVFTEFESQAEAEAFAAKLNDAEFDNDDVQYHYAQNGGRGDILSVHGPGYFNDVKVVAKAPALGKKVFALSANVDGIKKLDESLTEEKSEAFQSALAELVRDEDEPELSEAELKALIEKLAKKHKLSAKEKRELALAAEGPIGY